MLRAAGVSVRGPAHAASGEPNQDSFGLWGWKSGWIAVVSDGLGSRPLSHIGSRLACLAVRRVIRSGAGWDEPKTLIGDIYRAWLGALPIPPARAASTLLLAVSRGDGDTLVAQLGDGLLAYRSEGRFGVLTPQRSGFANQTDALGISRSWSDWQCARIRLNSPGDGVLMMTDGISDDLKPERLEGFFQMLHSESRRRSRRGAGRWLRTQLAGWPTPGHSDDKTVALIFRGSR